MSLVNDMLRDLNKRTPVSNRAARVHGAINSSIDNKRPRTRTGLILIGGVLAAMTAGYFYYESTRVQVVQVPLTPASAAAVVSTPQNATPAAANVDTSSSATALATADTPAIELLAEFRELATQPSGFTLLIELSEATGFDVRERSANGIVLHIDGVDRYDRSAVGVPGMSLKLAGDGLDVGFALNAPADFLVREDSETPGFDILITASYRAAENLSQLAPPVPQDSIPALDEPQAPVVAAAEIAPAPTPSASVAGDRNASVRVTRGLSFEERDRNNSQSALMLLQGGQMAEALQQLLSFLEQNPAAHQSRETLAKLLLAQQALAQAGTVVDQGLEQVPNYAPFKKIKARLLMQDGEAAQALALLRNVPPSVAADAEYHELLATLYQQGNYHQQAIASYQELLRTDRNQGRWWTGLGISLEAQNQSADAHASYQAALQSPNLDANLRRFVQNRIANLGSAQ